MSRKPGGLPPVPTRSGSHGSDGGRHNSRPESHRSNGSNGSDVNRSHNRIGADSPGTEDVDLAVERHMLKNPFLMPADEEVFRMREEEKRRKKEERELMKSLQVHEKGTFASRMATTRPPELVAGDDSRLRQGGARELAAAQALPADHRRREKENMADFVAKKREIFLVQMSLDTKRAEIRKLEERALQREEALRKSEQMLEEDALRFDAFLKENDEKVQEAIKRAEVEAKAKQDKVHEIKRLSAAIATIKSELNKYEEQLEDCRKYKDFLDKLTPPEYFKEQTELKAKRQAERKARREEKKAAHAKKLEEAQKAAAAAAAAELEAQENGGGAGGGGDAAMEAAIMAAGMSSDIGGDEEEEEEEDEEEEELDDIPMFFQRPQQLLDIFSQLEEQNLFLIQNVQETEEALEELKNKYKDTERVMETETDGLKLQIDNLQNSIKGEEEKSKALKERTNQNSMQALSGKEATLDDLSQKVTQVYERCGFEADASVSSLQMLTNIEAKLEEYLSIIDQMPEDFVEVAEKLKEKERRQRAREEKLEQQRKEQERRVQRSLERAQAPVHKKQGKPLMFRSAPPQRKKKDEDNGPKKTDEEEELAAFLVREF
mmetsp:Transcript_17130/g.23649  ORF Transcript_17130/g.23649 Transcript_17130/m.23649 type:complete len:605 (-) Transcript_17130:110-1924(-)|eukprot:CAMPEP_0196577182 /NCGR_PEP_ID=MMETSP1081-20130531/6290_1 /TAXON_ID=36882 /ORGANISM="Pyramimonas amylifera, Strain CCMP720" /LENGTH=604 /DNA_ID=CAMNT_0041896033 /DNA_START=175 /DNA_END=1989 /DNA_ORIENTATION=+